jgi:hypothetical protein
MQQKRESAVSWASVLVEKLLVAQPVNRLCQLHETVLDARLRRARHEQAFASNGTNMSPGDGSGICL